MKLLTSTSRAPTIGTLRALYRFREMLVREMDCNAYDHWHTDVVQQAIVVTDRQIFKTEWTLDRLLRTSGQG